MIVDKRVLPDDPTPSDAPPSYDTLVPSDNGGYGTYDRKSGAGEGTYSEGPSSSATSPPPTPGASKIPKSPTYTPSAPVSPSSSSKGKTRATNWFNFNANAGPSVRTKREVRTTVLRLVRDLIQESLSTSSAATGVLQSCADVCAAHDVSLSDILQDRSIENHTPLYWAIVKRVPDERIPVEDAQGPDLLTALMSFSSPLTPETISDVRLACLATSDQKLFQRLRMSPEFAPLSGSDQMLLGGTIPPDEIEVEDSSGQDTSFAVNFEVHQFHKRMVVSKNISLEFIAKGRMWKLAFFVVPVQMRANGVGSPRPGSWCISLGLLENSPPTFVDSCLLIPEAKANKRHSASSQTEQSSPASAQNALFSKMQKPKRTISVRLKSDGRQIEAPRRGSPAHNIVVSLEETLLGTNLQYGDSPYIDADERLRVRLEAKLGKPDGECIIC